MEGRFRPRLAAVALGGLALVPLGGAAGAAITPTVSAPALAAAIAHSPASVTDASFATRPPSGSPTAVSTTALAGFPTDGASYAILSTGDASFADGPNDNVPDDPSGNDDRSANDDGGNVRGDGDFDVTVLSVGLDVPVTANCLVFDFRFLTEEYPEFVGKSFNDAFIAELDTSDWTTSGPTITAPHNFAADPSGKPISVNAVGAASVTPENSTGTTYDAGTPLLHASASATPGPHTLYLSILDGGDNNIDSAVFVDNLTFGAKVAGTCKAGATVPGQVTGTPSGTVLVNGKPYTGGLIAYGSRIDVTRGRILLRTDVGTALLYGGVFVLERGFELTGRKPASVDAKPKRRRVPLVQLRLTGGSFKACGKRRTSAFEQRKKPVRRLWAKGKGRFRTRGRYSSAAVRGTFWLTEDRCEGTFTLVRQGRVEVFDFVKKKRIVLRAGKSYLAGPKARRRR